MKRKRRHLTAEFKARVATEAIKEEKSIQQIAQENDIAPTQVSAWKKELTWVGAMSFSCAICWMLFSSFIASFATRALNSAVRCLLFRFIGLISGWLPRSDQLNHQ